MRPHELAKPHARPDRLIGRGRVYALAICGGLAFVVSLSLLAQSPRLYRALAIVSSDQSVTDARAAAGKLRQYLADEDHLRLALDQMESSAPSAQRVTEVASNFRCDSGVEVDLAAGNVRLSVHYTDRSHLDATGIINRLVGEFVAEGNRRVKQQRRERLAQTDARAKAAARKSSEAENRLDQFTTAQADLLRRTEYSPDEIQTPAPELVAPQQVKDRPASSDSPAATTAVMVVNPRWLALKKSHENVLAQRLALLDKMTSDHPRVRRLDSEIADLAKTMLATAQQIETHQAEPSPVVSRPGPTRREQLVKAESRRAAVSEKSRQLRQELRLAKEKEQDASQARDQAEEELARTPWTIQPAKTAEATTADASQAPFWWSLSAAVLFGGCLAIATPGGGSPLTDAREARAVLPTPVIGVIPADTGPVHPTGAPPFGGRRWLFAAKTLRACEVVLPIALIAVIVGGFASTEFREALWGALSAATTPWS